MEHTSYRLIGSGETSEVWLDENTGTVIKTYREPPSTWSESDRDFDHEYYIVLITNEAMILHMISHAHPPAEIHLPQIVGFDKSTYELRMKFIKGETLANYLERVDISLDELKMIVEQVCCTLIWLRTRFSGFTHNDLHLNNIMISHNPLNTVIIDFCDAKLDTTVDEMEDIRRVLLILSDVLKKTTHLPYLKKCLTAKSLGDLVKDKRSFSFGCVVV